MISSAIPSHRYSWSFAELMSANGRTAIETGAGALRGGVSNAASRSCALEKRFRGSFSRQRPMTAARSSGRSARTRPTGGGVSRRIADASSAEEPPAKGRVPDAISYRTIPSEKRSVLASSGRPETCSGDMYGTVPITAPASESPAVAVASSLPDGPESVLFARPKSRSFTRPPDVSRTFAGFRSRWTIPFSCAAASASAICRA